MENKAVAGSSAPLWFRILWGTFTEWWIASKGTSRCLNLVFCSSAISWTRRAMDFWRKSVNRIWKRTIWNTNQVDGAHTSLRRSAVRTFETVEKHAAPTSRNNHLSRKSNIDLILEIVGMLKVETLVGRSYYSSSISPRPTASKPLIIASKIFQIIFLDCHTGLQKYVSTWWVVKMFVPGLVANASPLARRLMFGLQNGDPQMLHFISFFLMIKTLQFLLEPGQFHSLSIMRWWRGLVRGSSCICGKSLPADWILCWPWPGIFYCSQQTLGLPQFSTGWCDLTKMGDSMWQHTKSLSPNFSQAMTRALLLLTMECHHIISRFHHVGFLPVQNQPFFINAPWGWSSCHYLKIIKILFQGLWRMISKIISRPCHHQNNFNILKKNISSIYFWMVDVLNTISK